MPPKKEGTAKKPAKARTPTLINGLTREEMSKEQLEEHIALSREELDREREERNYFQLERDQIHTFWKITVRKLEVVEAELKNLDKAKEDNERRHQVEIQVYKQKMKHLLCEHQNTLSELEAFRTAILEDLQTAQHQLKTECNDQMRSIKKDMQELDNENRLIELKQKHDEEMTTARNNYVAAQQRQITEATAKTEKIQQEMESFTKSVITEQELMWNSLINGRKEDHSKTMDEFNTLAFQLKESEMLINKLEKKPAEIKAKILEMKENMKAVLQDCQHLSELISKVKGEIAYAERKTQTCSLNKTVQNGSEKAKMKALKDLRLEHVALEKKFSELQLERDKLYESLTQHEADLECAPLEKKLQALTDSLEKIQTQLDAVLSAPNMDHTALRGVINKVEEDLVSRNAAIKNLEFKRSLIAKARRGVLLAFEPKERALCVPVKQLVP